MLFILLVLSLSIGPSYQAFKSILTIPEFSIIKYLIIYSNIKYIQATLLEVSYPALEHTFILLRLAFTDFRIETKAAYFLRKAIPWDAWYKTHDAELLALFRPSRFGSPLAGRKQKAEWDRQVKVLAWQRLPRFGGKISKATSINQA